MVDRTAAQNSARKTRRNPRACDKCSNRSVRCRPSTETPGPCQNCYDYGESCTFNRPIRKRGARPKLAHMATSNGDRPSDDGGIESVPTALGNPSGSIILRLRQDETSTPRSREGRGITTTETPHTKFPQALVMDLTEIYFEVVYPVFPLFYKPSLVRRVGRGEYNTHQPFRASVMALCALTSARVRDRALYTKTWDIAALQEPPSETFFEAAQQALPQDAPLNQSFDYMRAAVLLAICAIQYDKPAMMHHYLGIYHSFVAVGGLHDESNWPTNVSAVELEERRRLFWSAYTLDVFTSIVWNGIIRSREASSNVQYPELTDNDIAERSGSHDRTQVLSQNWLEGWNFLTNLYRRLEHAADDLRRTRTPLVKTPALRALSCTLHSEATTVLDQVIDLYNCLPARFRNTQPITGDLNVDLYSFQAANIAATVQLLRMVYFTNICSTLDQRCQVASEVIAGFATVPTAYLRAISAPLLHHLGAIGAILGAAFGDGMTESSYLRIRSVLLDMANLLSTLEVDLFCPSGSSQKLRNHVSRIDQFMESMRHQQCQHNSLDATIHATPGAHGELPGLAGTIPAHHTAGAQAAFSPEFQIPPELLEDLSWIFDFTTASA